MPAGSFAAVRDDHGAGLVELSAAVFVAPYLFALLLDGPLLLWAERFERRRMLGLGVAGMALSVVCCALAPNLACFALAFGFFSPASGLACGIAQALLMDAAPDRREEGMTDWAIAGWLGDLAGPAAFWAAAELGIGYRWVFVLVALLGLVPGLILLARSPGSDSSFGALEDDDEESLPWAETWRLLTSRPVLLLWLFGSSLCSLLDELVAGLVGLRAQDASGEAGLASASLLGFTLGGLLGLGLLRWGLTRIASTRLLVGSCVVTVLAFGAWLLSPVGWLSTAWLVVVGASVAPHYPLAQARAYAALPERSTLVAAAAQPFTVVELSLPLAVGWVAEHAGLEWGLALLLLQPLGLLLVAFLARNFTPGSAP